MSAWGEHFHSITIAVCFSATEQLRVNGRSVTRQQRRQSETERERMKSEKWRKSSSQQSQTIGGFCVVCSPSPVSLFKCLMTLSLRDTIFSLRLLRCFSPPGLFINGRNLASNETNLVHFGAMILDNFFSLEDDVPRFPLMRPPLGHLIPGDAARGNAEFVDPIECVSSMRWATSRPRSVKCRRAPPRRLPIRQN